MSLLLTRLAATSDMATKLTSYVFRIPLVILRIILEDVCTQLIALRPFNVIIKSLSSTNLIGLRSSTFALFPKHAVMSLSIALPQHVNP